MKKVSLLMVLTLIVTCLFACGKTTTATVSATSATEETKKVKEDDTTNNSNKVKSNGYTIGNNIYILGAIDSGIDYVGSFHDGRAVVSKNLNSTILRRIIDTCGNYIIGKMPDYYEANRFYEGIINCGNGDYYDVNGNLIIDFPCDTSLDFSEGLAAVYNFETGKWGFIDKNGNLVIDYQYDSAKGFSEGMAAISNYETGKIGFIDKNDKFVIACPNVINGFSEGLAAVIDGETGKCGFIDKNGNLVINYQYDNAFDFSEGLACVEDYNLNRRGFIDKNGNLVIDYQYDIAFDFSEGLAAVHNFETGKWGFVDKNGNLVINYQYDNLIGYGFSEGLAVVEDKRLNKWGFIDKNGNFIIEPIFDNLSEFSEGLALAKYNGKTLLLTYLNPYDLGYTSNQLLNAKNILLASDTDGFFTEYYNNLERVEPNWIINTSNWNDNDYKKDLEKTIKEKEIKPDTWYVTEAGIWYYFESDRTTKKTGWYKDPEDNQTYYLNPKTGIMATGWTEIDGDMYYFNDQHGNDPNWFYNAEKDIWASAGKDVKSYGSMFRDEETPDGKRVDDEGRLIE